MKKRNKKLSAGSIELMRNATTGARELIGYDMKSVSTETDGSRFLYNKGSSREQYNAPANASNHIYLDGVTQSVPLDIVHELGSDVLVSYTLENITSTDIIDGKNWATDGIAQPAISINTTITATNNDPVMWEFTATINSGAMSIQSYYSGSAWVVLDTPLVVTNGYNALEIPQRSGALSPKIRTPIGIAFDVDIKLSSVKQITLPTASYLTKFSPVSKTWVEMSSTGDKWDYYAKDMEFDIGGITYPTSFASYTVAGGKLLGVGEAIAQADQKIQVIEAGDITDLQDGDVIALVDEVSRATAGNVGYNTTGLVFDTGNSYFYYQTSLVVGKHITYATVTDANNISVALRISTEVGAETDWEYFALVKNPLPVSTTYSQTASFSHAFSHTSPLTDAEVAQLTANPDLIWQVWFNSYVLVDGFAKADIVDYWPAVDAESGQYVQNVGIDLGVEKCDNGVDFANWELLSDSLVTTSSAGVKLTADGVHYIDAKLGVGGFDGNSYYRVDVIVSENTIDAGVIELFRGLNITTSSIYLTSGETGRFTAILKTIPSPLYSYTWAYVDPSATAGTYLLISEYSIRKATVSEIANYTSNCRTNYKNTNYGPTNLVVIQDGSGRPTAISPAGTTQWRADGRTAVTGWTITAPFTVYEELDGVKYVWTSDGNKYVAGVASGTYTLPTGVWTMSDNLAFDDTTIVSSRGNTKLFQRVLTPTEITAL